MVELVMRLVSEWSPPGDEAGLARILQQALLDAGADEVILDEEVPGSPSVIGWLRGSQPGPVLQWHGHLDAIVTPQAPPYLEGDRIVARGACDMKGSLAAMVFAVRALREAGLPEHGSILLTFHGLHEEGASVPLLKLFERGIKGDAVLIGEGGAGDDLMLGAGGLSFWDMRFRLDQEPLHETKALADDRNIAPTATRIFDALQELGASLTPRNGSLFVGSMTVGDYYNRVPIEAAFSGTRRHSQLESLADVRSGLERLAAELAREHDLLVEIEVQEITEAYVVDPGEPIISAFRHAHREVRGTAIVERMSPTVTNAAHFVVNAGIPALGYGPNSESAHSDHESVSVDELLELVEMYALTSHYFLDPLAAALPDALDSASGDEQTGR